MAKEVSPKFKALDMSRDKLLERELGADGHSFLVNLGDPKTISQFKRNLIDWVNGAVYVRSWNGTDFGTEAEVVEGMEDSSGYLLGAGGLAGQALGVCGFGETENVDDEIRRILEIAQQERKVTIDLWMKVAGVDETKLAQMHISQEAKGLLKGYCGTEGEMVWVNGWIQVPVIMQRRYEMLADLYIGGGSETAEAISQVMGDGVVEALKWSEKREKFWDEGGRKVEFPRVMTSDTCRAWVYKVLLSESRIANVDDRVLGSRGEQKLGKMVNEAIVKNTRKGSSEVDPAGVVKDLVYWIGRNSKCVDNEANVDLFDRFNLLVGTKKQPGYLRGLMANGDFGTAYGQMQKGFEKLTKVRQKVAELRSGSGFIRQFA